MVNWESEVLVLVDVVLDLTVSAGILVSYSSYLPDPLWIPSILERTYLPPYLKHCNFLSQLKTSLLNTSISKPRITTWLSTFCKAPYMLCDGDIA
jgi:hypothetical protein